MHLERIYYPQQATRSQVVYNIMSNKLIKIRDIFFYADTSDRLRETIEMEAILCKHNIGCYHRIDLVFNNPEELFDKLRSAAYGPEFDVFPNLQLPVVTWKEYYDDYERCINIAKTPSELQTSNLINNLHLVVY